MSSWNIVTTNADGKPREIWHSGKVVDDPFVYDYRVLTPIALVPMNNDSTFVFSEQCTGDHIKLKLHDLRVVDNEMVSSIMFNIHSSQYMVRRLKNDINRSVDKDRCVGIGYFFRKLNYCGFNTIYVPKKLKPKKSSALETFKNVLLPDTS